MKKLLAFLLIGACHLVQAQTTEIYTNNFTTKLEEGGAALPRADSLKDIGIRVKFDKSYLKYDQFNIEIYCKFDGKEDMPVAYKIFVPNSNEFKVKYSDTIPYDFWILNPNGGYSLAGDFESSPKLFTGSMKRNTIDISPRYNDYYVIVKGYLKTGTKRRSTDYYGNVVELDNYDSGTELSRSVSFVIRRKHLIRKNMK